METRIEFVNINKIYPNKLNPRKNIEKNTEDMQKRILKHGWETLITVYEKGNKRIIISGHRRWYAAKRLAMVEIPVFVIRAPKSESEELEMLAAAQSGQIDWTAYEWAKYTFNLYYAKSGDEKKTKKELADKFGVNQRLIHKRIQVFEFFPHPLIEDNLKKGILSISILSEVANWIIHLTNERPEILEEMKKDVIIKKMVKKAENKCFSSSLLRVDNFYKVASIKSIKKFINDSKLSLKEAYKKETGVELKTKGSNGSKLMQNVKTIEERYDDVSRIEVETSEQASHLLSRLEKIDNLLKDKLSETEKILHLV